MFSYPGPAFYTLRSLHTKRIPDSLFWLASEACTDDTTAVCISSSPETLFPDTVSTMAACSTLSVLITMPLTGTGKSNDKTNKQTTTAKTGYFAPHAKTPHSDLQRQRLCSLSLSQRMVVMTKLYLFIFNEKNEDVPLVEFTYPVFTRIPDDSYGR